MKTILLLTIISPIFCFCQAKKDTKINVIIVDTTNIFKRIALSFIDAGYSFETKDESLGFIATGEKSVKKYAGSSKLKALIQDSTITFSGLLRLDISILGSPDTFSPVSFHKNRGNLNTIVWDEMVLIAKRFGDKITYSH